MRELCVTKHEIKAEGIVTIADGRSDRSLYKATFKRVKSLEGATDNRSRDDRSQHVIGWSLHRHDNDNSNVYTSRSDTVFRWSSDERQLVNVTALLL